MDGRQEIVDLEAAITINEVKDVLRRRLKFEAGKIRFIYSGVELADSLTVENIHFRPDTFIVVHFTRSHAVAAPPPAAPPPQTAPPQPQPAPPQFHVPARGTSGPYEELQQLLLSSPNNLETVLRALSRSRPALANRVRADPAPFLRQIGLKVTRAPDGSLVIDPPEVVLRESDFSPEELEQIRLIMDLGFPFGVAAKAWREANGDTDLAAALLLSDE
jgi:hypothetical protein